MNHLAKIFDLLSSRAWVWRVAVAVVVTAIYANSLKVPFLFDDNSSIAENESLRSVLTAFSAPAQSGVTVSGRPVLNATLALNYAISRENVWSYHAFNVVLHILNALVLFGLLNWCLRLPAIRDRFADSVIWLSGLIALLWACHPLQTESVTYVVQRAESLVSLFYLLTFYCFVRSQDPRPGRHWPVLSVICCAAGMASKEVMVTAPLALLSFDWVFIAGSLSTAWRLRWRYYLVLFSTWTVLGSCILSSGLRGGTVGAKTASSVWSYLLTQSEAVTHYLRLSVWPTGLIFDHGRHLAAGVGDVWPSLLQLAAIAVVLLWAWRRHPKMAWPGTMVFLVLAPSSSLVPVVSQTMAEHRMYLPLAPLIVLLVAGGYQFARNRTIWLGLVVVGVFGILTVNRNQDYRSLETIWRDTVEKRPDNARAWLSLAMIDVKMNRYAEAKPLIEHAMTLEPGSLDIGAAYADVLTKLGDYSRAEAMYKWIVESKTDQYAACYNFGTMLLDLKRYVEAERYLIRAVADKKYTARAHYNLGNCYLALGRHEDAIASFRRAILSDISLWDAYVNLSTTLIKMGKYAEALGVIDDAKKVGGETQALRKAGALALVGAGAVPEAITLYQQMLSVDSADADLYAELGLAYSGIGRSEDAIGCFRQAIKNGYGGSDLGKARALRVSLATLLQVVGQNAEAASQYEQALLLDAENAELRFLTAHAFLLAGRARDAAVGLEKLMQTVSPTAEMKNDLGVAYLQLRRFDDARKQFEAALKLRPEFSEARDNLNSIDSR